MAQTDDLERRLRRYRSIMRGGHPSICDEAADEIARLRAENFKLAAGACTVEGGLVGDDHGHFDCSLKARLEALERELAEARDYARKVSIAFTDVTGGGSEMFTRIGNEFYADPEACRARVRERYESARKFGAMQEAAIRNGDKT